MPSVRDLASPEGLRDPYAVYARFRDAEAAGHDIDRIVVRYDQVAGLLADRRLSSDRVGGILAPLGGDVRGRCPRVERTLRDIVAFRDPPDHTRIRRLLASTFSFRMVQRVEGMIEGISARLLEAVAARRDFPGMAARGARNSRTQGAQVVAFEARSRMPASVPVMYA